MDLESPEIQAFLSQLATMTRSDPAVQVSMYDVGDALGIDRALAGQMAETLFMGGLAEFKTLAGGIGITAAGLSALGLSSPAPAADALCLGSGPVLDNEGLKALETVLAEVKAALAAGPCEWETLEEAVMDVKTIEVQLLSPRPKTAVIREVLHSLSAGIKGQPDVRTRLETLARS